MLRQILTVFFTLVTTLLIIGFSANRAYSDDTQEKLYSLNIYAGQLVRNHWWEIFSETGNLSYTNSYLTAVSLARRIGTYKNMASFEVEGQVVKHFNFQDHWEINSLITVRWDSFFWDKYVDTSFAFGVGPSYATEEPEVEILKDGATSRFLVYWMMELAIGLPEYPNIALITRIHHRSNAYRLVAEKGGSNAPAIGLKIRF